MAKSVELFRVLDDDFPAIHADDLFFVQAAQRTADRFDGDAEEVAVTVYWDRPATPPNADTPGRWKLVEHRNGKRKVLAEIDAALECDGDDLYCHLPDGDVPPGFDVFPDYGSVLVLPEKDPTEDLWWEFNFRPRRKEKAA